MRVDIYYKKVNGTVPETYRCIRDAWFDSGFYNMRREDEVVIRLPSENIKLIEEFHGLQNNR